MTSSQSVPRNWWDDLELNFPGFAFFLSPKRLYHRESTENRKPVKFEGQLQTSGETQLHSTVRTNSDIKLCIFTKDYLEGVSQRGSSHCFALNKTIWPPKLDLTTNCSPHSISTLNIPPGRTSLMTPKTFKGRKGSGFEKCNPSEHGFWKRTLSPTLNYCSLALLRARFLFFWTLCSIASRTSTILDL